MEKENDLILNMLANPDFGVSDFQSVGLKAENTGLRSEDDYKRSEKITKNELFQDEHGNFDESKFHNFYVGAGYFYNKLSQDDYNKSILELAIYSKDNIWVDPSKRVIDFAPKLVREPNEHLINSSLTRIGKKGKQTMSDDEIAQTQKVYNTETGEWTDSPNDSFFSNFFTPLVRATYDEDEYDEEGNLIHEKGERKLNEDGLPYYETLGGRNISGKNVLNKMNVLTTDGSTMNKFDFFDSDDLEQKNKGASILKNAALVGSMFIPYVGPVVTGLSVLSQTAGLIGTFGKMAANLSGSDDSWANELEGWAKSVNRNATTQYAAENTWCWENFFNLIGDSVAQLQEQRWIFKAAPTLFKGPDAWKAMSTEGRADLVKKTATKLGENDLQYMSAKRIFETLQDGSEGKKQLGNFLNAQEFMNENKAYHIVDELASKANKIGSPISKAYMIGLTVGDTYQEAKDNGASDLEAALLTAGYAMGETAILNSELGEWILPELRNKEFKNKAIVEALAGDMIDAQKKYAEDKSKKGFVKAVVDIGKRIAGKEIQEANLKAGSRAARMAGGMVLSNALGESFEEVSEEALADASKALFNVSRWIRGQEGIDWHAGDDIVSRYAQSALGGFIGGGIASAGSDFVAAKNLANMDKTKAMQELLYMVNNDMEGDFLKSLDKMKLGNEHLSARTILDRNDESGQVVWAPGNKNDNQDLEIKKVLKNLVQLIKDALDSEGARISTNSLINTLELEDQKHLMKDMRFNMLSNAASLGLYLQDYQNIQSELVKVKSQLNELEKKHIDSGNETAEDASLRQELTRQLGEIRQKKDAYISGQMAPLFIRDAIYEMNPVLHNFALKGNIQSYAKFKTGKKFEDLSDAMKEKITQDFATYKATEFKDDVHALALMYDDMIANASPVVEAFKQRMQNANEDARRVIQLHNAIDNLLSREQLIIEDNDPDTAIDVLGAMMNASEYANDPYRDVNHIQIEALNIIPLEYKDRMILKRAELPANPTLEAIQQNKAQQLVIAKEGLLLNLELNLDPLLSQGFLHPEAKKAVLKTLDVLENYAMWYPHSTGDMLTDRKIRTEVPVKIREYKTKIEALNNTPILDFISQYQAAATESKVNIMDHWKNTMESFDNAREDISDLGTDSDWEDNNAEVAKVIESFGAVVSGMRADNADFGNITSYSKIMNEVSRRAGVLNPVQYSEIDEDLAGQIMQDLSIVKKRLDLTDSIVSINKGLKLKQQTKVGTVKNHIIYNAMLRLATTVLPDDDDDPEIKGGRTLKDAIANADVLLKNSLELNTSLTREDRLQEAAQMMVLEDAFHDFFLKNNNWSVDLLGKFLSKFAGPAGFFNKTGLLLTENSTAIDDNAFIWWMASRAALKSTDFHGAYNKALEGNDSDKPLAAIPSQELATYLGVASVTNMDTLNKFVDAYKNTVVKNFKGLSEEDRNKYLNNFKGYKNSNDLFATLLLDYFSAHDSVPQFHNMIFIEGGPGTGKSKGVYKMVINTLKNIDPDYLNNAMYVHATQKSAEQAASDLNLSGEAKSRELFLKWISDEWKDARLNKIDGKAHLYDGSYEFTKDGLVNKWKLNAVLNPHEDGSTTPKVIFIDEISHYNQLELSMIEQFARQNQIVVLTAGDLNLDTFTCYAKVPGLTQDADVTISRNNFIRTPKLGVSLRTLNKQMTGAVRTTQSAFDILSSGDTTQLSYNYHEGDSSHPGLYGVKIVNPSSDTDITDTELSQILPTVLMMIDDLQTVDGELEKIGYIYSSSNPDSKLHKYLSEHFGDKVDFFADTDAQGLEGKYYIVDLDRKGLGGTTEESKVNSYLRSLYTGITRAEKGVLAITPAAVGNITSISSIKDPKYQIEELGDKAIKKSAEERKSQLDEIFERFADEEGIYPNDITIQVPTKHDLTMPEPVATEEATTGDDGEPKRVMPEPFEAPEPPVLDPGVYTDRADAEAELSDLAERFATAGITTFDDIVVSKTGTDEETSITSIETIEDGEGNYFNQVTLENGTVLPLELFLKDYSIKAKDSEAVVPKYREGLRMVIDIGGTPTNVYVDSIDTTDPSIPIYRLKKIEDDSDLMPMIEDGINYIKDYVEPVEEEEELVPPITGFENEGSEYTETVTDVNQEVENTDDYDGPRLLHRVYTHAAFETGVERDPVTGKIVPLRSTSSNAWLKRIDSMIGLTKLTGDLNYDNLMLELGALKNDINTKSRSELEADFNNTYFGGQGVTRVDFAFKSSAVGHAYGNDFDRYHMASDEELQYILSQDPKAKIAKGKKLVAIFNHDGKNVLEVPIGVLNSPLTIANRDLKGQPGKKIFRGDVNGVERNVIDVFTDAFNATGDTYKAIDIVLQTFQGQHHLDDLMDLFKVYRYTSNGIFYLPSTFELNKQQSNSPELVNRSKGDYQLNQELYWDREFVELPKFAEHVQHNISSIFMSSDGKINGIRIPSLHPGHSFVLVSDDNSLKTDDDLVTLYEKQIFNPSEPKKVKLYYIVPPKAKVSSWLTNLHNIYRNRQGENLDTWYIGNNFTSYNVLKHLIDSGHFDDPEYARADNTGDYVKRAIQEMKAIEQKWQQKDIAFGDFKYKGVKEEDLYENLKSTIGEKAARREMTLREQAGYLQKKNDWGTAMATADKTIEQALNSYLTTMIWPKPLGPHSVPDPARSARLLLKLDADLAGRFDGVYYRAKYDEASKDVHSFKKVITKGSSGVDKYTLPSVLGTESKTFAINDKIDTATFTMDDAFTDFVRDIANSIVYTGNHWEINPASHFKKEEFRYIKDQQVQQTPADIIKSKYSDKFADGTLNASLLDPNKTEFLNLVELAKDYTLRNPNQWGFVHNGLLVLTRFTGSNQLRFKDDISCAIHNADEDYTFTLYDSSNNPVQVMFWFDVDTNGFITGANCRCTDVDKIEITTAPASGDPFTSDLFTEFMDKTKTMSASGFTYAALGVFNSPAINTFDDIVNVLQQEDEDGDCLADQYDTVYQPLLEQILGKDHPVLQALTKKLNGQPVMGGPGVGIVLQNDIRVGTVLKTPSGRYMVHTIADPNTVWAYPVNSRNEMQTLNPATNISDFTNVYKEIEHCATINWARI